MDFFYNNKYKHHYLIGYLVNDWTNIYFYQFVLIEHFQVFTIINNLVITIFVLRDDIYGI